MKLYVFTIVLDGMPFLPTLFANLNRLPASVDWRWSIAEGAAMNVNCTRWCQSQAPRLSVDGTSEFLAGLRSHPRIRVHQKPRWEGKLEMVATCLVDFREPGVLLECDSDELFLPHQLEGILALFAARPAIKCARFFCRYFVGANIVITSEDGYGNRPGEWQRAWRWSGHGRALSHEPPVMEGLESPCATREETRILGLVFDHYAYAFEKTVEMKERFYGYRGAVAQWRRLQTNTRWPVRLRDFLPWVDDRATADLLVKPTSTP
jgi:hypothetical protein